MQLAQELVEIYASTSKAIVFMTHVRAHAGLESDCIALLCQAGIPVLSDGLGAATAVAKLAWYQERAERAKSRESGSPELEAATAEDVAAALRAPGGLSEHASKQILARYGVPITREARATMGERTALTVSTATLERSIRVGAAEVSSVVMSRASAVTAGAALAMTWGLIT